MPMETNLGTANQQIEQKISVNIMANIFFCQSFILFAIGIIAIFNPFGFQRPWLDSQGFASRLALIIVPVAFAVLAQTLVLSAENAKTNKPRLVIFAEITFLLDVFFILPTCFFYADYAFVSAAFILGIGTFLAARICTRHKI